MKRLSKKQINENIEELKDEINWYGIKKSIANAMLELAKKHGFEFSGHGCGLNCEDFNLSTDKLDIIFCDQGSKVLTTITTNDTDTPKKLYKGTINGALKYVKNYK